MRVLFLEDVPNQASAGDVKDVSAGFARNYLIPKKLAIVASAEEMKRIQQIKQAGNERRLRETQRWDVLANQLEGTSITVKARATLAGQFYGAITPVQIAQELSNATGREIDRKLVEMVEPIKEPGAYEVVLHLAPGVQATILVAAEAEE